MIPPVSSTSPHQQATEHAFSQACIAFSRPRRIAASDAETALLASAIRTTHVHEGEEIAVWNWGSGPRVLMVHGWDSRGSHFAGFVQPLLRAGFSVTLFDMPAHGDSSGQHGSVVHSTRALLSLATGLSDVQAVITHSMGSAASLLAFCQGLQVKASVHLCGPSSLTPMLKRQTLGYELNAEPTLAFHAWVEDFIGQPIHAVDIENLAEGLRHPALIMHDPEDKVVPFAASAALNKAWSGSALIPIHGVGHRRILSDNDVITHAVAHIAYHIAAHAPAP